MGWWMTAPLSRICCVGDRRGRRRRQPAPLGVYCMWISQLSFSQHGARLLAGGCSCHQCDGRMAEQAAPGRTRRRGWGQHAVRSSAGGSQVSRCRDTAQVSEPTAVEGGEEKEREGGALLHVRNIIQWAKVRNCVNSPHSSVGLERGC